MAAFNNSISYPILGPMPPLVLFMISMTMNRSGLRVSLAISFTKEQRKETLKSRKNLMNLVN